MEEKLVEERDRCGGRDRCALDLSAVIKIQGIFTGTDKIEYDAHNADLRDCQMNLLHLFPVNYVRRTFIIDQSANKPSVSGTK